MSSSAQRVYNLRCNDCTFERVVVGEIGDVLDIIEGHQEEYRQGDELHIVDTELRA